MLEVCQKYDQKGLQSNAQVLNVVLPLSQMLKGKRESQPVCRTFDAMDDTGHRNTVAIGQQRKDIDTASTSPESNSVMTEYRNGFTWKNNPYTTDFKDIKSPQTQNDMERGSWDTDTYASALLDGNASICRSCNSEETPSSMSQRMADLAYLKSDAIKLAMVGKSLEAPEYRRDIHDKSYAKTKRASSFSGAASYGGDPTDYSTQRQYNSEETDTTHSEVVPDSGELVANFMTDLRKKRSANTKYPTDTLSFVNNKYTYDRGPLGFPNVVRDAHLNEMIKNDATTVPFTVFSAYTPSHNEENAITVQPADKVCMLARHNQWIYVSIAESEDVESIGTTGWIPEDTIIEPELFARSLQHDANRTHTFNKFV
ncbi:uncharacterized protein BXIN_2851 [Babesia sp. Xinjiang]|uniref:uncharacterized protein n=1 Tax=Babesia sp. Xinjiang TaxID=462227 RepID=UPI000A233FC1|nr:uncharacterized protein BXIN_2851 [Babesia sp. Xinjiang]ORM39506.1 hypothetical protein BXIN_2851 [Babesia sp. Xinjiang]